MRRLIINPNFKIQIYKELSKSKRLNHTYRICGVSLIVHMEDLEEVEKVMKRLLLKFK
jgi:hypothetical protein